MSFFDTEEAHAVMLAKVADRGPVDHRSSGPGSSPPECRRVKGKSRLKAPARFGAKKDIHIPPYTISSRIDAHCCCAELGNNRKKTSPCPAYE